MFALNDIVTWTHPRTGNTHTGVIVQLYGNGNYVVQVWRRGTPAAPAAHVPTKSKVAEETALTDKK